MVFMTGIPQERARTRTTTRSITTRVLAVTGTAAVGVPLAAPLFLALALMAAGNLPIVDFLVPGELFPVVLGGATVLVVTAILLGRWQVWAFALTAAAMILFAGVNIAAAATGLASGAYPGEGWRLAIVLVVYGGYVAAALALFVFGILLCRSAFGRSRWH